ncbi:hypothetical protein [Agromyces allii]|nr:hypothetical protein [Agromyces allii]
METRRNGYLLALALVGAGALLTACTSGSALPSDPPSSSSAPPATSEPSADASPDPEASGTATTCDTVLTPAAAADLAADGLEPVEVAQTSYPFADELAEAGALVCKWGKPSSDVSMLVVQLSGVETDDWTDELTAAGYVETGDPVEGAWTGPIDGGTGLPSVVLVEGDRLTFVSAPDFVDDLA